MLTPSHILEGMLPSPSITILDECQLRQAQGRIGPRQNLTLHAPMRAVGFFFCSLAINAIQMGVRNEPVQQILRIDKMSLLQLLQQTTSSNQMMLQHYMAQRALEQRNLLTALAIALNKSVTSFQMAPQLHPLFPTAPTPPVLPREPTSTARKAVIEIISESEQFPVGNQLQLNLKNEACRAQSKNSAPSRQDYKTAAKNQELNPTSAENIPEQPHKKNKTKPIKKIKHHKQQDYNHTPLPALDQLDACHTPKLGMGRAELAERRQRLMGRQVEAWGCPMKKEKRELRMLSF